MILGAVLFFGKFKNRGKKKERKNQEKSEKHSILAIEKSNGSSWSSWSSRGSWSSRSGELPRPVLGARDGHLLILAPLPSDALVERVVRVWGAQQSLHRDQHGSDLQGRGPLVLKDVEADAAELVYVWVVDLGEEADLRRRGKEEDEQERWWLRLSQERQREGKKSKKKGERRRQQQEVHLVFFFAHVLLSLSLSLLTFGAAIG